MYIYVCIYIYMYVCTYLSICKYVCIVGRSNDKYSQAVKEIKETYTEADLDFLLVTCKTIKQHAVEIRLQVLTSRL